MSSREREDLGKRRLQTDLPYILAVLINVIELQLYHGSVFELKSPLLEAV